MGGCRRGENNKLVNDPNFSCSPLVGDLVLILGKVSFSLLSSSKYSGDIERVISGFEKCTFVVRNFDVSSSVEER